MRDALASCDMGAVIRAFRMHPFHRHEISQEIVAGWGNISDEINSLKKLTHWAQVLRIPAELLWFRMPNTPPTPDDSPATAQPGEHDAQEQEPKWQSVQAEQGRILLPVLVDGRLLLMPLEQAPDAWRWKSWLSNGDPARISFGWTQAGSLEALEDAVTHSLADRRGFMEFAGSVLVGLAEDWMATERNVQRVIRVRERMPYKKGHPHMQALDEQLAPLSQTQ
jgi:hypothetical protein